LPKLKAILEARQKERAEKGGATWFSIKNVSRTEAEVLIYDEIGIMGITAGDFVNELREVKASKITLRINSSGGDVFDAIAIYNNLRSHPANIEVYIDGIAASAASFIAMAGETVIMSPHSQMMVHDAHGLTIGNAADMRQMADILDKSSDNIAAIYAERTGMTVEEWREKMRGETWFSDHEAVQIGLANWVDGQEEEAAMKAAALMVGEVAASAAEAPKPEPEPVPVDFGKVFDGIVEESEEAAYARR
jgi:ATP-dependent protease ClpP protease subunit